MSAQSNSKCKLCRRAGEKLFLRGDRCGSPKCAFTRKSYAPGVHGSLSSKKSSSEFGRQLAQKQKLKRIFGISERQFRNHLDQAKKRKGVMGDNLIARLELRLDSLVFRMGLSPSRKGARQLVGHGMFLVNGKNLNIPSAELRIGDVLKVKENKASNGYFSNLKMVLKKNNRTPEWVSFDADKMEGKVLAKPNLSQASAGVDMASVIEFYSRS